MSKRLCITDRCRRHRQQGIVLPLLAVGMLAIIGIVGLSIDIGHAFLNKTRLQNSLDSAALSGARTLMLSNDIVAASADARAAFDDHLQGELSSIDANSLVLQYSNTLVPFISGGSSPRYVRALIQNFTTKMSFSSVLPDVDESLSISGSAVAGPIPVGYPASGKTCDIAPLLVCGVPGDSDCSDGTCFGYEIGTRTEYEFHLRPSNDSESLTVLDAQFSALQTSTCGDDSVFYGCVPTPDLRGGTGNFLLNNLDCADDACIRNNTAGDFSSCLTHNASVETEKVTSPGPVLQGLMTRFGAYHSSLSAGKYPSDVVNTNRTDNVHYWHDIYKQDVASVIKGTTSYNGGVPYRRVITVPIVSCPTNTVGHNGSSMLGFVCFYLSRLVEEDAYEPLLYGQLVSKCEASGEQGASVPRVSNNYSGPMEVVLYKDPENDES